MTPVTEAVNPRRVNPRRNVSKRRVNVPGALNILVLLINSSPCRAIFVMLLPKFNHIY